MVRLTLAFFALLTFMITTIMCSTQRSLIEPVDVENGPQIIGGGTVELGQALFMAALRTPASIYYCGGAILNTRFVLTAASCMAGRTATTVRVVVGLRTLNPIGTVYAGSAIITYPGFVASTRENDISLVQTAATIVFTQFVQPIPISRSAVLEFSNVIVYGWGQYTADGEYTVNYLQYLNTTGISNSDCKDAHQPHNAGRINDNKLCTLSAPGQGICFGDQGSPLVGMIEIPFEPSAPKLVGVASWHTSCAEGYPDVYERVAPYYLWIQSQIN